MIQFVAGAAYPCCSIHSIAAHGQIFFYYTNLPYCYIPHVYAHPKLGNNAKAPAEFFSILLQIFPGINNCGHAFTCIFSFKKPRYHNFVTHVLVNPSIMLYQCHGNMKNKIADEFKIFYVP